MGGWGAMIRAFGMSQIMALYSPKAPESFKTNPSNRFDYSYERWKIADRSLMNVVEQTGVFFTLLWAHAVFVDAPMAGTLGLVALLARSLYPLLRAYVELFQEFSTQSYQVCMAIMACNLVSCCLRGAPVLTELSWAAAPTIFALYVVWTVCSLLAGIPGGILLGMLTAGKDKSE